MLTSILSVHFSFPTVINADTVILKSGKEIFGKLQSQTMLDVVMIVNGKELLFSKKRIRSIRYGETEEEKALYERLKKLSEDLSNDKALDLAYKKAQLDRLQKELSALFKEQESRRRVAETLDEEFRKILEKERSGPNGLLRQAAFPGWGHYYMDQNNKAVFWSGLFAGMGLYALNAHQAMIKQRAVYESSLQQSALIGAVGGIHPAALHYTHVEGVYQDYVRKTDLNNRAAGLLLGAYVASLMHLSWDNWLGKMFLSQSHGGESDRSASFVLYKEKDPAQSSDGDQTWFMVSWRY